MEKVYLIQLLQNLPKDLEKAKEGMKIYWEMPPFCSGDYEAEIHKDEHGLFIEKSNNYMNGCRNFEIK